MNEHIRIRNRRRDLGMSQEELAELVGYTGRSAIARMESGQNKIPINKIPLYAKALHTTKAYILGLEDADTCESEQRLIEAYRNATEEGKAIFMLLADKYLKEGFNVRV